jgi:hypothetical protein
MIGASGVARGQFHDQIVRVLPVDQQGLAVSRLAHDHAGQIGLVAAAWAALVVEHRVEGGVPSSPSRRSDCASGYGGKRKTPRA